MNDLVLLLLAADRYMDTDFLPFMRERCRDVLHQQGMTNDTIDLAINQRALEEIAAQADELQYTFSTYAEEGIHESTDD